MILNLARTLNTSPDPNTFRTSRSNTPLDPQVKEEGHFQNNLVECNKTNNEFQYTLLSLYIKESDFETSKDVRPLTQVIRQNRQPQQDNLSTTAAAPMATTAAATTTPLPTAETTGPMATTSAATTTPLTTATTTTTTTTTRSPPITATTSTTAATTSTSQPSNADSCYRQTCDQTITGRRLSYNRSFTIQSFDSLLVLLPIKICLDKLGLSKFSKKSSPIRKI